MKSVAERGGGDGPCVHCVHSTVHFRGGGGRFLVSVWGGGDGLTKCDLYS